MSLALLVLLQACGGEAVVSSSTLDPGPPPVVDVVLDVRRAGCLQVTVDLVAPDGTPYRSTEFLHAASAGTTTSEHVYADLVVDDPGAWSVAATAVPMSSGMDHQGMNHGQCSGMGGGMGGMGSMHGGSKVDTFASAGARISPPALAALLLGLAIVALRSRG